MGATSIPVSGIAMPVPTKRRSSQLSVKGAGYNEAENCAVRAKKSWPKGSLAHRLAPR
jgi:hypothetical protein